ncbi:alpha/beta hydrolase, partial [Mycolicibacterium insubricum]|uniref:alpha/beta hydrolase n=1 Tax=Mycolicibacterium insubricum TaxID=444597 RepID=UPI0021F2990E
MSDAALRGLVPDADLDIEWPRTDSVPPVLRAGEHLRNRYRTSVRYGDDPEQVLDVWRRKDLSGPAPVMIFVPGGAWVHGGRILQGYALLSHLAEMGWVCLSVEYRVAPGTLPRHIRDV